MGHMRRLRLGGWWLVAGWGSLQQRMLLLTNDFCIGERVKGFIIAYYGNFL